MTKTLRMLGLSSVLATGMAVGAMAATQDMTTSGSTSTTVTRPSTAPNTYGSNGQVTTNSGDKFVTGDGRVGNAAPSAGAKVGGGTEGGASAGTGGASR